MNDVLKKRLGDASDSCSPPGTQEVARHLTANTAAQPSSTSVSPEARRFTPDFAALFDALGDLVYTLDLDGRFTYLNQAVTTIFGYEPADLIGRNFVDYLSPGSASIAHKHYAAALANPDTTPFFEIEVVRPDGTPVHLEIRAGNLVEDGVVIGRQGVARDINLVKDLQTQVTEKSRRMSMLEDRTRIVMTLYASIADMVLDSSHAGPGDQALHEIERTIRNMRNSSQGWSEMDLKVVSLLAKGNSNEEIAKLINRSPHTVKDYVSKVMQRLGAKRRAEAVACAIKLGLIDNRS